MSGSIQLWCCGCEREVSPRLTSGKEIYPHRPDLSGLPFWKCDSCKNFVGCHHKTANRTKPLGCIATAELKRARQHIHKILDPLWKGGRMRRGEVYSQIASSLGLDEYHTAEIKSVEQAREVYRVVQQIAGEA